ncbi:MAG: TolC family protein [Saprospiraceae bacterium]|nr:TolC family protein [Saprospiraceae bacterium]
MKILSFLLLCSAALLARAQSPLSLPEVVARAKAQSTAARQAATTRETRYWEYRTFQSNFKPQLLLDSRLPAFSRSFNEVVQPDGTILFQPVRNNNSSVGLSLEQQIARTGGTVYATTQVQRFDDFSRQTTLYNGTLFAVGLEQPLFRFNTLKWARKIEPLKYRESQQEYIEAMEQIAATASRLFFDLLLAQVNQSISETNLNNTSDILRIAQEKFELGKISRNEILQLQLEQLKAEKALGTAKRDVEISSLNLKAYIGLQQDARLELIEPYPERMPAVPAAKALEEAYANRADAIAFSRRLLEAERAVAQAKAESGLNASLTASLGFSNRGPQIGDLYNQPQNQQLVALEFTMPILDWGRAQSRRKTAEANQQLTQYTIEQDQQNFKQQIFTQVTLFDMLQAQLSLTARADSIAAEKYQIAKERYVLGNLSITELSIAFAEKDQARRDFIGALRDYWAAFYQLRWLTLYDFEKGEKIQE